MDAGKLDQHIVILQKGTGQDAAGQPLTDNWIEYCKVWAQVLYLNGKETVAAGKESSSTTASMRIRKRDVTSKMRVQHDGFLWEIKSVLPGPRREFIDLVAVVIK